MKRFLKLSLKILELLGYVLSSVLVILCVASLIDWWGLLWFLVALSVPILVLAVITVVYRLLSGSWTDGFIRIGGLFSGCIGLFLLSLVMLCYPVIYRFVEGKWPITYLVIAAIVGVINFATELSESATKKASSGNELEPPDSP